MKEFKRILIIRLSGVGDIIHTLPLLVCLRENYPRAWIAWVVKKKFAPLLSGHRCLDEIILFDREKWWQGNAGLFRQLRSEKFDLVIDPQVQFRSGLLAKLTGAKTKVGFDWKHSREGNWFFLNSRVTPKQENQHVVEKNLDLIRSLGIECKQTEFLIPIQEREKSFAQRFLEEKNIRKDDFLIGINPGASIICKTWLTERYAAVADAIIQKYKAKVLLFWGPGEEDLVEKIASLMKNKPIIAPPTDLKQLGALALKCRLFISPDSGPLHLAAALGVPAIGLYGHTDPIKWGPYGPVWPPDRKGNIALQGDLTKLTCPRKRCRWCKRQDCMSLIEVDDVLNAIKKLIGRR